MSEPLIFIAGPLGILTQRLLLRLLADTPAVEIVLLVSNDHRARALDAIAELPSEHRHRVSLLEGDVAAIDMGLSGKEYRVLTDRIRLIHFITPLLRPSKGRKRVEHAIVGGAREALELGRNCAKLERLVYYGSALVSGNRTGTILESELEKDQTFRGAFEENLAIAERMVRARFEEMPISVLRPSLISCDSKTGEMDRDSPIGLLASLLLNSPQELPFFIPGDGDVALNLTSADFLVDVALRVASWAPAIGKTFHVTEPEPPSVRRFFELIAEAAGRKPPSGSLSPRLSKALFNAPGPLSWAKTPRALLEILTTPVRYDSHNTELALSGSGIEHPRFESYVELLVSSAKHRDKK